MKSAVRIAMLVASLLVASGGLAQDKTEEDAKDAARSLTAIGKQKLESGDYKGALQALDDAEKYFHAPTITLLRATAHEKLGQLVEAEKEYSQIATEQLPAGAPTAYWKAKEASQAALASLAQRIPKLTVVLRGAPAGARVLVDGADVTASVSAPLRLNPGAHEALVKAGETTVATRKVTLKEGAAEVVDIDLAPPAPPAPLGTAPRPLPAKTAVLATGIPAAPIVPAPEPKTGPSWVLPAVAFGVGGVGIVVGAITGALTFRKMAEIHEQCGDGLECTNPALRDTAYAFAHTSTATFIVGGVGLAFGTFLVLTRPGPMTPVKVGLAAGPTSLTVKGVF